MTKTKTPRTQKKYTNAQLNKMPLWKLLEIGLADLRKQERHGAVDMRRWIAPPHNGQPCKTCLGGSVMRFSCGVKGFIVPTIKKWAWALDSLRRGSVTQALDDLCRYPRVMSPLDRLVTRYNPRTKGRMWWRQMGELLKDLKKAGI